MAITYTNRKGVTYHLCRGLSRNGKPRYYFAREPRDESVQEVPAGYKIAESVNGVVSLVKDRPAQILSEEVSAVEVELRRHHRPSRYRVGVKGDRIVMYEMVGPDAEELATIMKEAIGLRIPTEALRAHEERHAQYTPILRFTLHNAQRRTFYAERWCFRGSIDDWIDVGPIGPIRDVCRQLIPKLDTDEFYELF
ncbi:MAG: hypothetical protein ACUVX1_18385 [Chloroflexota bacterium]